MVRTLSLLFAPALSLRRHNECYLCIVIDPDTLKTIDTMRPPEPNKFGRSQDTIKFPIAHALCSLVHPAGLAIDPETNVLFAVAQEARAVYAFNVITRAYIGAAVKGLNDDPEQILLSKCTY